MYLSSRATVFEAFEAFKTYPKLKQMVLYNLIPMGLMFMVGILAAMSGYNASTPMMLTPLLMLSAVLAFCGVIAAIAFYYISYVHVIKYFQNGQFFATLRDFLKPQQSIFRLFWKTTILPFLIVLLAVAIASGFFYAAAHGAGMIPGMIITVALVAFFIWAIPKFAVVVAYLIANTSNGLRDGFAFSKGYYWYLTRVLFWVSLIYIGLEIAHMLLLLIGKLVLPELIAFGWTTLVELAYIIGLTITYIFMAFVFGRAYYTITENPLVK